MSESEFEVNALIDESEVVSTTLPLRTAIEPTGDARVDSAMQRLADTETLPTEEQIAVFDEVHRRLGDALTDIQS